MTKPAIAPKGEFFFSANRTLASLQEQEFDRELNRLRLCYGVGFESLNISLDRRRSCKAILVKKLKHAVVDTAKYFARPIKFQCQDTAETDAIWEDWRGNFIIMLQPNSEKERIDTMIAKQTRQGE